MKRVAAAAPRADAEPLRAEERVGLRVAGRSFELPLGSRIVAGRAAECALLIDDQRCSRQHAVFSRATDGGALVRDLGSTNGTYVNGVRISTEHRLARGDWTTIGNETIELCILQAAPRDVTPTIPARPGRKGAAHGERAGSKTEPGSPLLSLASLAGTAARRTPANPGVAAAKQALAALLERIERGESVAECDAEMAGRLALHLAASTADPAWLDYLFRLYTALRAPLPAPLLDRLAETLARVQLRETATLRAYIATLRSSAGAGSKEAQQRLARLVELQLRCEAERQ